MKIFVSWSGDLSHKVAVLLKEWLPDVIHAVEPFVSSEDLDKGSRWFADVSGELEDTDFGILCLTLENLGAAWLVFEAGALSKSIDRSRVCPLLIGLSPTDLEGPLAQFQATTTDRDDMLKLVRTINHLLGESRLDDHRLLKSFGRCWSELKGGIDAATAATSRSPDGRKSRPTADVLDELLRLSRSIAQSVGVLEKARAGSTVAARTEGTQPNGKRADTPHGAHHEAPPEAERQEHTHYPDHYPGKDGPLY